VPLPEVAVTPLHPERFADVLAGDGFARFEQSITTAHALLGTRQVWNVNSTAFGGGVAEMLRSLMGYVRGAGIDGRWVVAEGDPEFFRITKRLHNRLHGFTGDGGPLGDAERAAYEQRCEANARALAEVLRPGDVVILHDPQTAGMIPVLRALSDVPLIWRAHIGLDLPNDVAREAWSFLIPYVKEADAYVFSREAFAWEGLDPARVTVIPPSIDAFAPKNQTMSFTSVTAVLRAAGLARDHADPHRAVFERLDGSVGFVRHPAAMLEEAPLRLDAPLLAQVSRWDRLKDPLGVLAAFAEHVHAAESPHLLLAGPDVRAVADDPEGAEVLAEVEAAWHELPPTVRRRVHLAGLPMEDAEENAIIVNALQRRADVVAQKSLAEGFGLTVAEAMWKGRPVVATTVGGIQDQIEDGDTGYLVEPRDLEAFGERVNALLRDPHSAERMGEAARTRVRDLFLGPRHLGQYVELLQRVLSATDTRRSPDSRLTGHA
jgi:trehalose synthase